MRPTVNSPNPKPKLKPRQGPLTRRHGWAFLTSLADYDYWNRKTEACYACPPDEYPCFVREEFTSDGETCYLYFYAASLMDLLKVLFTSRF